MGGKEPRTESAVLVGLLFNPADFCDFRTHRPRMRIDDLSAPSGRFAAHISASVATVDLCPGRERALPPADSDFASVLAVPTEIGAGSAEDPAAAAGVARPTPSRSPTEGTDSVETTRPTASAPAPPGSPAPPTVKPSSDLISTWTRRRTAIAASTAPPAAYYGFGPFGAPQSSARRANIRPRVPRTRPAPPAVATPAPAASTVPTVPIPSATAQNLWELLLLPITPPPSDTLPAPTKLDTLGDAAEVQFADSVARCSHADWEQQQQAEPTFHGAVR